MNIITESLNFLLNEGLAKGYYFWDTSDSTLYDEGGRYNTFAEIKKVNTSKFYSGKNVDNSLTIGYSDGKDFWAVDKNGKQKYKLST